MAIYYNVNTVPATGAQAFYNLGKVLSSSGWTIQSSSNGTNFGAGELYFTTSSLAATNAWFTVREPSGPGGREWCFQRTTSNIIWRVKVSPYASFTGSATATRVPTATDEGIIWGSGTDASPTGENLFFADGTYKFHIVAESTPVGPAGNQAYGFWAFANLISSYNREHSYMFVCQEPLASGSYPPLVGTRATTTSGDADPCTYGITSVRYAGGYVDYTFNTAYFLNGFSSGFDNLYNMFKYFYDYKNASGSLTHGQEVMMGSSNGTDRGFRGLSTGPFGYDIGLPYHVGRQASGANTNYYALKATFLGLKGRLNFLRIKGTNRSNGIATTNLLGGASSTYIYVGDLLIPWPDGIPANF